MAGTSINLKWGLHSFSFRGFLLIGMILWAAGCSLSTRNSNPSWEPTEDESHRAEIIARSFALEQFQLDRTHLEAMKAVSSGITHAGKQVIWVRFYHPQYFDNFEIVVRGGFPNYFTIDVDTLSWTVVDYYAYEE
jgi:hypothetical protein